MDRVQMDDDNLVALRRSRIFKGLNDDEIRQICRLTMPSERSYDKNQIIINQGEHVSRIGIIKSGTVISMKYHFNGDAQILRIYKRCEVLSLDAVNTTFLTSPVTLLSQSDCSVIFVPYKKLFESESINSSIKEVIMFNNSEILSNELVRLMYKIDVLSKRTLQERIMTYLSIIREKKRKKHRRHQYESRAVRPVPVCEQKRAFERAERDEKIRLDRLQEKQVYLI